MRGAAGPVSSHLYCSHVKTDRVRAPYDSLCLMPVTPQHTNHPFNCPSLASHHAYPLREADVVDGRVARVAVLQRWPIQERAQEPIFWFWLRRVGRTRGGQLRRAETEAWTRRQADSNTHTQTGTYRSTHRPSLARASSASGPMASGWEKALCCRCLLMGGNVRDFWDASVLSFLLIKRADDAPTHTRINTHALPRHPSPTHTLTLNHISTHTHRHTEAYLQNHAQRLP